MVCVYVYVYVYISYKRNHSRGTTFIIMKPAFSQNEHVIYGLWFIKIDFSMLLRWSGFLWWKKSVCLAIVSRACLLPQVFCGEAAGYAHSMVLDTVRKGSVEVPTSIIVILFKHMQHYIVKSNFASFFGVCRLLIVCLEQGSTWPIWPRHGRMPVEQRHGRCHVVLAIACDCWLLQDTMHHRLQDRRHQGRRRQALGPPWNPITDAIGSAFDRHRTLRHQNHSR